MRPTLALLVIAILALCRPLAAEATFSIAAVDPGTGEVGSAGASCISGSLILSDVHPGVGVVHTETRERKLVRLPRQRRSRESSR
jgi:hypothetical protein